ncbi:MAG: hypothetical protein K5766_03880 [Alphaproteobacteria bacterium]|nr:hypothetical protein [Alphaproteobacteria bacterium]
MNTKTNSIYADLPEIVEAIRRYAVMYGIKKEDIISMFLSEYTLDESEDIFSGILGDYLVEKIMNESNQSEVEEYLKIRVNYYLRMDISDMKTAPADIITKMYQGIRVDPTSGVKGSTDPAQKVYMGMRDQTMPYYGKYFFKDNSVLQSNSVYGAHINDFIWRAFWNKNYPYNNKIYPNTTEAERIRLIKDGLDINGVPYLRISNNDHRASIVSHVNSGNENGVKQILENYVPLITQTNSSEFINTISTDLFKYKGSITDTKVSEVYIDNLMKYCYRNAWVPSLYIQFDLRPAYDACIKYTWKNTVIPAQSSITTKIQNVLKNLGSGKTLKAGLKSQFNVSGTSALVNDENEWPVANGTSEIDNYKYTDAFDNKEKVNILDYTYDKLIGDVRAIDAKTAYEVLKARADAINDPALDTLVSSDLRSTLKSAVVNATTEDSVKSSARTVLENNIISQKASTTDNVKDRYAKMYRSVNIDENTVALEGVTDAVSVNAAFDQAIFGTMNGYLAPNGTAGIFEGVEGGVTGFIDAIYGTDTNAQKTAVRQVAMNWITAREEEFKAADIAEKLIELREGWTAETRTKYWIESFLRNHNVEGQPSEADILGVLEQLKGLEGEAPTVKTSDITTVKFTYDELSDLVQLMRDAGEISDKIRVEMTPEEKTEHLVKTYLANHVIESKPSEAALYCAVTDLKNMPEGSTVTTDDIAGVNFTKEELDDFVEDMKEADEIADDITVVPSDDERIMDEVKDYPISNVDSNTLFRVANYLKQTGSEKTSAGINGYFGTDLDVDTLDGFVDDFNEKEGTSIEIEKSALESYCRDAETPAKMKDLGEEKLAEIVEYLKKPKNQEIYNQTSYLLKLDEEKSSSEVNKACGTDLTYDDLSGLVTYMNKKVSGLNLSIEKTNKEKLMDHIDDYLTANPSISGLPSDKDKAKAALYKLAVCFQSLGGEVVVRDSQVLEKCGISGEVSLDYKQQKHFANYLLDRGWYIHITIKGSERSDLERTRRLEINDLISSAKPAAWVDDPSFTSYRLDGYLKFMWPNGNVTEDDITEAHVKGCWSDLVTYNFRLIIFHPYFYPDIDWGVSKKDRDIIYEIDAEAAKVINSRIPAKNILIDSIKSYVSALYEAREIDNKFSQIVNDDNHLGALNADETKAEILTKIITDTDTMNAKIDSFYAALTSIAQAVREYAVMCIFKDHPIMMTSDWINTAIDKYIQNSNESILENIKGDIDAKVLSDTESNAKQYLKCRMNLFEPYIELQNLTDSIISDIYDDAKSLNDVDAAISAAQQKYDTLTRSKIRANQIISRIANFEKNVYLNTIIPAKADISAQIRNCLTNIGYGKTIRDALKAEFKNSTLAALVDDSNAYPVANSGDDYANFKISASGNAVDVLNYTHSRIKNNIIEIDADATYNVLETQANAVNNAAIDKLVSSDLRDTMRSASANVTTKDAIKTTAYNVLLNNIIAQKSNTSDDVKRSYAKVAYGRILDVSNINLSNVNNENGVKTAFCNAIYATINPYIFPQGKTANFSAAGTNVVEFIEMIDGNDFPGLYTSTKKLIDNTSVLTSSVIEQLREKLVDYVINLASNGWNE